jgi:hypothetical protein
MGPGGRPFRRWRALPFLLAMGAFGANAVILLSDRAPGLLGRISARIDAGVSRAAGATGVDLPGGAVRVSRSDYDVHVALWAVAALLVGLATWSWLSLFLANGTVFACSVALELAQGTLTNSRSVQRTDLLGNASGVILGTCAVAAFAVVWRAIDTMRS